MKLKIIALMMAVLFWGDSAIASNLFYVYGNNVFENMPNGENAYHPENYGATLLGTSDRTKTFYGSYNFYIITAYPGDVALIDAVQGSDGNYISSYITGNTSDYQNSWGAPDGMFAYVGQNNWGGALVFDVSGTALSSITVFTPPPYYCDDDNDGYHDSTNDGACTEDGCIPAGCQAVAGTDCDDMRAEIHPGALELFDGVDNNCDGEIDEGIEEQNTAWKLKSPLLMARDQFAGGVIDGKIYVFGGNGNPDIKIKSTEMYDPLSSSWSYKASNENNGGFGVEELSGAVVNGKLYVFGALGGHDGVFSFVEEYDPVSDTWNSKAPMNPPRTGGAAVVYNGEIYLFGGFIEGEGELRPFTELVQVFNPSTNQWRSVTDIPKSVCGSAIAVVGEKAFLFGGYNFDEEKMSPDVLVYNFQTGSWTTAGYAPLPNPRWFSYAHSAPVVDGKIYLVGGFTVGPGGAIYSNMVDIYDIATDTWTNGPALTYPTDCHLTIALDNSIFVVGGRIGPYQVRTATVWELPFSHTSEFDFAPSDGDVDGEDLVNYVITGNFDNIQDFAGDYGR